MHRTLFRWIEAIHASYWFLPSVMAFIAILLGAFMVWLDVRLGSDWLSAIGWYQSAKADGAHEVLSTIAGSMITVAGVVFSITIVAIAYAASQYGPRILTNFMSDRGNQFTLGTFIATFVYCLVVLRTIRGGDDESFVPQMAVLVGLMLALASIGVLIYFIHHVPQSIHLNTVVARIGRHLIEAVGDRFPVFIGDPSDPEEEVKEPSRGAVAALERGDPGVQGVRATDTGYIQMVDDEELMRCARKHDLVLRLHYRPGDYVHAGRVLLDVWPLSRMDEGTEQALRRCYALGNRRTPAGDYLFLVDELVEIAARALSTGVNDPHTAMICLDWVGAGASEMARRRLPQPRRVDEDGTVRVVALPDSFGDFIERGFGRSRQYVARDMNAALHALRTLGEIAASCCRREQIQVLGDEADRLMSLAKRELNAAALDCLCERAKALKRLLDDRPGRIEGQEAGWLGGSASAPSETAAAQ